MAAKKNAIWITGASSGIGKALAIQFAKNNHIVIGTARRKKNLDDIKNELGDFGKNFESHQIDISDLNSVNHFYSKVLADYQITCLINNAGITSFTRAENDSVEEIKNIIETNLLGSIYAIKSVLPEMIEKKSGTIINILSVVTQKIFTESSAYSASKSGLHAYSKVLREEVRDKNIRVINVSPGATATPIWPDRTLQKHSDRMMNAEAVAQLIFRIYSEKSNLVTEEVVIRPILGDL